MDNGRYGIAERTLFLWLLLPLNISGGAFLPAMPVIGDGGGGEINCVSVCERSAGHATLFVLLLLTPAVGLCGVANLIGANVKYECGGPPGLLRL